MAQDQQPRRARPRRSAAAKFNAQQAKRQAAAKPRADTETASPAVENLRDAMPTMILRFCVVTLLLGAVSMLVLGATLPDLSSHGIISSPTELRTVKYSRAWQRREATQPTVEVLNMFPHDAKAFTQGLLVVSRGKETFFIESTGLYGHSSLRLVDVASGEVLDQYDLPQELFGEGVTLSPEGELILLTWKSKRGFVFELQEAEKAGDTSGFSMTREFTFETVTGQGWGLDSDGEQLLVSDGSSTILFWDPATMTEVRRIQVTMPGGSSVSQLNELEVANGFIYANVWYTPFVLKIDPQTGDVLTVFDCSALIEDAGVDVKSGAVLNGIAYDGVEDVFYLTGKLWGALYKVRLLESAE